MTSSTKPDVHNVSNYRQSKTEPQWQEICTDYFVYWASMHGRIDADFSFFSERELMFKFAIWYRRSVCLLSVCLFVWLKRWCTLLNRLKFSAIFLRHTIARDSSFLMPIIVGKVRPFPPEICAESDPPPFQTAQFRPISAHSASTVRAGENSSISTNRKSTTRFPTSHRWTVYVTPNSPKGWHKNAISLFVPVKFKISGKKSLLQNFFV